MITLATWETLRDDALIIRREVFVAEQSGPAEDEPDALDPASLHAVAYHQGIPVGTGRLLPDGRIGRMAVRRQARGTGIGGQLLQALITQARALGHRSVALHAQLHACGFYAAHGFHRRGAPFMEAGIEHILMVREI